MKKGFDQQRVGVITASNLHKVINVTPEKMSQTAKSYLMKVFSDKFIMPDFMEEATWNSVSSYAIRWGNDHEEEAINYFNLIQSRHNDSKIALQNEGFYYNNSIKFGATTDAFIVENTNHSIVDGCLEVKCPYDPSNQMKRFVEGIPREYYWQCIGQLITMDAITRCTFASYDPRLESKYKLYTEVIHRSDVVDDMNRALAAIKTCNEYLESLVTDLMDIEEEN